MACPFFCPTTKADRPQPSRTPLGSLFEGECQAYATPHVPTAALLYEPCNFGYGREVCPSFPVEAVVDAVRFSRSGSKVLYILEREHRPVEYGEAPRSGLLGRQADAFEQASSDWRRTV